MKSFLKEYQDAKELIYLKDKEIKRLVDKCERYRQIKNWTIIISIVVITLIAML